MPTINWNSDDDWDQFREVAVSGQDGNPPDNTLILTGDAGVGRVEGVGGTHGNDRRLYLLDGITAADVEMRVDFTLETQQAQFGLVARVHEPPPVADVNDYAPGEGHCAAVRAQHIARADALADPGSAMPTVWNNIFFQADSMVIAGGWQFAANELLDTGGLDASVPAQDQAIVSADGDGTLITIVSAAPHQLVAGQAVNADFGPFNDDILNNAQIVNDTTFTVESTVNGSWTEGRWRLFTVPLVKGANAPVRTMAMRVVGDSMSFKQWFPAEPEPGWDDPRRAATVDLPSLLQWSHRPPPASGALGLAIAHLNGNRVLTVRNLEITVMT